MVFDNLFCTMWEERNMIAIVKTTSKKSLEFVRRRVRGTPNLVPGMEFCLCGFFYLPVELNGTDFQTFKTVVGQLEGVIGVTEASDD